MKLEDRVFGWIKDKPDSRDMKYTFRSRAMSYPASFSTQVKQPPIQDQGPVGCCVGEGCARLAKYGINKIKKQKDYNLSVLFAYWNARALEGNTSTDAGSSIRDGIKGIAKFGICQQALWPFDTNKVLTAPNKQCFTNALKFQALGYESLFNKDPLQIKDALFHDFPVTYGKLIYPNFQPDPKTGVIPYPNTAMRLMGGHCMVICGWNDNLLGDGVGYFLEANSWSVNWGLAGYCWVPYTYVCSGIASDFWAITKME
jgi:C1A family cysteine protease